MTQARHAEKHALYETAVQQPIVVIGFIEEIFAQMIGREPLVLREDFCGTAYLSSTWVRSRPDRKAVGVDIDAKVLRYAQRHHRKPLGDAAGRLTLVESDVLACRARADVLASLNFSHCIYKTRDAMVKYLTHARRRLADDGVMILDIYGGPDAQEPCLDKRRFGDFVYEWEQQSFDPITADVVNHIHFRFPDGSARERAFTYRWRLWTLPELREMLEQAGFTQLHICFESEDGYIEEPTAGAADAWVAYLIAYG